MRKSALPRKCLNYAYGHGGSGGGVVVVVAVVVAVLVAVVAVGVITRGGIVDAFRNKKNKSLI